MRQRLLQSLLSQKKEEEQSQIKKRDKPEKSGGDDLSAILKQRTKKIADKKPKIAPPHEIKSVNDNTWLAMGQATVEMAKETNLQPKWASPVALASEMTKKDRESKQKKPKASLRKAPPQPPVVVTTPHIVKKRGRTVQVPPQLVMGDIAIETLEQHSSRSDQAELFRLTLARQDRDISNIIVNQPDDACKVLQYCAKYKPKFPWFAQLQSHLVAEGGQYDHPDVPVMSRKVIQEFLREAKTHHDYERPCANLDRDPQVGDSYLRCVAHELSEKQLGPGNGFRLRELLLGGTETTIRNALANKMPPQRVQAELLPKAPGVCYLCHLWMALCLSIDQRDKLDERARRDMPNVDTAADDDDVQIINEFMVIVDVEGEYDGNYMLTSDKIGAGIWGCFPLYNEDNYIVPKPTSRAIPRHIIEKDGLVFRLTPASQEQIVLNERIGSNQSTLTRVPPANGRL